MSGGRPRRLALLAVYGRTGRPGARFVFGPLKPGFESSDRLASPIGSSARPCALRCRLWARDGALRAHFFAASFGLDTASRGTARLRFARLGPVLDAGNPQPSASCCRGLGFGEQGKALLKLVSTLEFAQDLDQILRGRFRRFHAFRDVWSTSWGFPSVSARRVRGASRMAGLEPAVRTDGCTSRVLPGCSPLSPRLQGGKVERARPHSSSRLIHQSTSKLRQIQRSKPLRRGTDNPEIAAADRCCITLSARR